MQQIITRLRESTFLGTAVLLATAQLITAPAAHAGSVSGTCLATHHDTGGQAANEQMWASDSAAGPLSLWGKTLTVTRGSRSTVVHVIDKGYTDWDNRKSPLTRCLDLAPEAFKYLDPDGTGHAAGRMQVSFSS